MSAGDQRCRLCRSVGAPACFCDAPMTTEPREPDFIKELSEYGYAPPPFGHQCGQCGIDWSKYETQLTQRNDLIRELVKALNHDRSCVWCADELSFNPHGRCEYCSSEKVLAKIKDLGLGEK